MRRVDEIVFKVSDRGRGIPPEMIDRVFDRFETFPNGSRHRGPGLGLSIVKAMVELHGGRVLIDTAPNEGTTVTCIFPVEPAVTAAGVEEPAARRGEAENGAVSEHGFDRRRRNPYPADRRGPPSHVAWRAEGQSRIAAGACESTASRRGRSLTDFARRTTGSRRSGASTRRTRPRRWRSPPPRRPGSSRRFRRPLRRSRRGQDDVRPRPRSRARRRAFARGAEPDLHADADL